MKRGNTTVEQVDKEGFICIDYDTSLSVTEIYDRIKQYFPHIYKSGDGMICGEHSGKKYSIRAKNITYLGNPHPHYKKRIQISDDLRDFYNKSEERGMQPLLLGIYTYRDNVIFCEFAIDDFVHKKAHNSSAHVYTSDLSSAASDGYFQKIDYFGNRITVFKPEIVNIVLDELLGIKEDVMTYPTEIAYDVELPNNNVLIQVDSKKKQSDLSSSASAYVERLFPKKTEEKIEQFFGEEDTEWYGIDCYTKMINSNYRNKYQPEWAGFYLEYEFEGFILREGLSSIIRCAQDKSDGGIDLDLYFPDIMAYGDLKAHSENSRGIQGNDWDTVFSILNSGEITNHIYYIVCEHGTIKDSERGYEVTKFWNHSQHKKDEMSYSKRMKNTVILKRWMILDINSDNKEFLTMFKQGINSDGKPRNPKIMIEHDKLSKFVIAEGLFKEK